MSDSGAVFEDTDRPYGGDERQRPKRLALVLVLLLLLLLCVFSTLVSTWVEVLPAQRKFVENNVGCLKCHTEMVDEMSKASVHQPFVKSDCVVCHTPHGTQRTVITLSGRKVSWRQTRSFFRWLPLRVVFGVYDSVAGATGSQPGGKEIDRRTESVKGPDSELQAAQDQLCWTCHGDLGPLLTAPYTHAPFQGGHCTDCHNPHASEQRVLLKQSVEDLCVTCHPLGPELAREQVHPPVAERHCTNCHQPHGSDYRGILVDNQRDLCFRCHPSVAPLSLKAVQHQPFLNDNCTGCHEPHGSDSMPLLYKDQPSLCYDCHPGLEQDFKKPSHHPVGTAKLNCADCHDPHGADYEALLTAEDNEFCYQCHSRAIQASYDASKHEPVLCIKCHTPHGSAYAPILRDANPDVCLKCHDGYDGKNKHPVRPTHLDVVADAPLTCTSTCHDPHGSKYEYMVRGWKWPLDGQCLQCHSSVGTRF